MRFPTKALALGITIATAIAAYPRTRWSSRSDLAQAVDHPAIATTQNANAIYPRGSLFPLGLYSVQTSPEMAATKASGWNLVQRYNSTSDFLRSAQDAGMWALAELPGTAGPVTAAGRAAVTEQATLRSLAWWNLPEERHWWVPEQMLLVTEYARLTRQLDPQRRPVYMYLAGDFAEADVAHYVPYLDIVPAAIYTHWQRKPHAWARWRMEATVRAISDAGARVGRDYIHGEKVPVAVLELFHIAEKMDVIEPAGAFHDFWQAVVSGARGILVYSYYHKRDRPELEECWAAIERAASVIAGPEHLGEVILRGARQGGTTITIRAGPDSTVSFAPSSTHTLTSASNVRYLSVDLLTLRWRGNTYVIAVNSAEAPVSATISGLPRTAARAVEILDRTAVPLRNGTVDLDFPSLGVHVLRIPGR